MQLRRTKNGAILLCQFLGHLVSNVQKYSYQVYLGLLYTYLLLSHNLQWTMIIYGKPYIASLMVV